MRKKDSLSFPWMLDPVLQQHNAQIDESDTRDDAQRVMDAWFATVGPQTAKNARPYDFYQGILTVRVRNPIWFQELHLHKGRITQDLNRELGGFPVRELRLEQGTLPPSPPPPKEKKPPWQQRELPPHLVGEIERKLAHLPETDLKQSARRIMTSHFKRTRFKHLKTTETV